MPVKVTDVPIIPLVGDKLLMAGVTLNATELTTLPTVTSRFCVPAGTPLGTMVVMLVLLQALGLAATPPRVTVLEPCVAPKFVPVIVMDVPSGPEPGAAVMAETIVSGNPLLNFPFTTTSTLPVPVLKIVTGKVMLLLFQLLGVIVKPFQNNVLVPWVAPKLAPLTVIVAGTGPNPIGAQFDESAVMLGPGVKFTPLLARPFTVTTTFPVVAPTGTVTPICVSLQLVGVAGVPLKVTVLEPCVAPKCVPVIPSVDPTARELLSMLLMVGAVSTVNRTPLLLNPPPRETATLPVLAPVGTGTVMLVSLQLVGVASFEPKATVLVPCVAPKLLPVMFTELPTTPEVGDRLEMAGTTVKLVEFGTPPTVTVNVPGPAVTPFGTGAVMLVLLQAVGVDTIPLKVTMLEPCVEPKFVPLMVIGVPSGALAGDAVILGTTVNDTVVLLLIPRAITRIFPVPEKGGAVKVIVLSLQLVGVIVRLFQNNELVPWVAPKFCPLIVNGVPAGPALGDTV